MSGWRFGKGLKYAFDQEKISAGGYLVIARDLDTFRRLHPGAVVEAGESSSSEVAWMVTDILLCRWTYTLLVASSFLQEEFENDIQF